MAKDVLSDEESALEEKADKVAADKVKERVAEPDIDKPEPSEPVEVNLDDADEELEPATEAAAESRKERRRNRYREVQEERAAALRRAEEAERREAETRNLFLQQMQQVTQPQQPVGPDPLEAELEEAFQQQRLLYRDYNARLSQNAVTPQDEQDFLQKAAALQKRILVTGGRLAIRENGQQTDPERVKKEVIRQQMMQMHGDVLGPQSTQLYCDGVWRQLRAKGRPDDWSTLEEAAEITRRDFGMQSRSRRPVPSEASKRKLSGQGRGGGGPTSGESPNVITLGAEHKRMANSLYKHIPSEAERYKRWAQGPGKRLLGKEG